MIDSWSSSYKAPAKKAAHQSMFFWLLLLSISVLLVLYAVDFFRARGQEQKLQQILSSEPIESFVSEVRVVEDKVLFTENYVVISQGERLKHGIGRYLKRKQSFGEAAYAPRLLIVNGNNMPVPSAKPAGEGEVYFIGQEEPELPKGRNEFVFQYEAAGLVQIVDGSNVLSLDLLGPAITDTNLVQAVIYTPPLITRSQIKASAEIVVLREGGEERDTRDVSVEVIPPPNPTQGSDSESAAVKVSTSRVLGLGEFVRVRVEWP